MDEHLQGRGDRPAPVWVAFSRRELLTLGGTLAAGGVLAGCARAVDAAGNVLTGRQVAWSAAA